MPARIIQVPIDEPLLAALDEASQAVGSSRAALIRLACREYLRRIHEEALDDAYEEGYRRIPERPDLGESQVAMLKDVLPAEQW
jgi:metal-responsive CopG/Arc/MetJ family transcriptional regulator